MNSQLCSWPKRQPIKVTQKVQMPNLFEIPTISLQVLEFYVTDAKDFLQLSLVSTALYATVFINERKSKKNISFTKTSVITNEQYHRTAKIWKRLVLARYPDFGTKN
jgi:hypothetical protein